MKLKNNPLICNYARFSKNSFLKISIAFSSSFKGFFQIGNQTPSTRFQKSGQKSNIHSRSNNRHKNYMPCTIFSGFTGRLINSLPFFLFCFFISIINLLMRGEYKILPVNLFSYFTTHCSRSRIKKIVFTQRIVRVFYSISEFIENIEFAVLISES